MNKHLKYYLLLHQIKKFGQLITIAYPSLTMLNSTNTEFSFIEVWFTDQIEIEIEH